MSANKFKVLLCCYAMGITGCNKVGNPSYMDGGDGKKEKTPKVGASVAVEQSSSTEIDILGDSTNSIEGELSIAQDILGRYNECLNLARNDVRVAEDRVNRLQERLDNSNSFKLRLSNQLNELPKGEKGSLENSILSIEHELSIAQVALSNYNESVSSAENDVRVAEDRVNRLQKRLDDSKNSGSSIG